MTEEDSLIFHGLDPELGKRSKNAHIALTIALSVLMIPACLLVLSAILTFRSGMPIGKQWFWIAAIMAITALEVLTWFGLCLLFFKHNDPWWQHIVWSTCCAFGIVTTPFAMYGCGIAFIHGHEFIGITLPIVLTTSLFCLAQGYIHARRAHRSIKRITRLRQASKP